MNCTWPRCVCKATGEYCSQRKVTGPKPKKAIKAVSTKGALCKEDKKTLIQTDAAFYLEIWMERAHIDFESSEPIPGEFRIGYFHHVLAKRKSVHEYADYGRYRHCKWNIVLLNDDNHNTTERRIELKPKVQAYTLYLKQLHEAGLLEGIPADKPPFPLP